MRHSRTWAARLVKVAAAAALACCQGAPEGPSPAERERAVGRARALAERGWNLKAEARLGEALDLFEEACAGLEKAGLGASAERASCLDDQASIHLRMGRYDEARALYWRAARILDALPEPDERLRRGVASRLERLATLERAGVGCSEPAAPPEGAALPYFPEIEEMHRALGKLPAKTARCGGGAPRPVTLHLLITGDGRILAARARGAQAGTPEGECVESAVTSADGAALPRFRACFRTFTYPFVVGDLPPRKDDP